MKGGKYHFGIDLEQALTLYAFFIIYVGKNTMLGRDINLSRRHMFI